MRILHLLSNSKWTERAEPAADLALGQRALGHDIWFACGRWTLRSGDERSAELRARAKGLEPLVLDLPKHFSFSAIRRDVPRLRDIARTHQIDVMHAHMENAHLLAALALRGRPAPPLLVRQSYEAEGPVGGLRSRVLHHRWTDGLIVLSERAREASLRKYGLAPQRVEVVHPGIDLARFNPERSRRPSWREPDTFWVGMVTRIRKDRRVDLPIRALAALRERCPTLRLLIVGRGEGHETMRSLAAQVGVADRVRFAGYLTGEDLVTAYRALDLLVYPRPGTDQSCRTVREAMAMGIPVLAGRTGYLPELVEEGITGFFITGEVDDLVQRLAVLSENPSDLKRLGAAARETALRRFQPERQAADTLAFYERIRRVP